MKKFVIYTAIFGKMSRFRRPTLVASDVDRICFTDLDIENDFYQMKERRLDHLSPAKRNRLVKIWIPDEIFDNYEYSFYVDYKHPATVDFDWLLNHLEPQSDFLARVHPRRDCIYDEGIVCVEKRKDKEEIIMKQLDFYKHENYPTRNGLYAAFWLFRRHTKKLREFSRLWWGQVKQYSLRDQISLPYVAWKHDMKISSCGESK